MSPLTPFHKTLKGSNPAAKLVYNISQWESASTSARCDIHPQVTSPWGTTGSLSHVTVFVKNSRAQTTPHPLLFPSIFCVCVRADATRCKHWCQLVLGRRLGLLKHIFWDFLVRWLCKASEVFCVCVVGGGRVREWMKGSSGIRSDYVWCYQACETPCQSLHHGLNDGGEEYRREFVCMRVSPFV